MLSKVLEISMLVCFGASWPLNMMKSYHARTTKGKSLPFLVLIFIGYIAGILAKLVTVSFEWYVLFFYVLNFIMVGIDLLLYYRNYQLDKKAGNL